MDLIDELPSHEKQPSEDYPKESSYLAVWEERRNRVINILKKHRCHHIVDLGCGEGRLFQAMKFMPEFRRLVGLDIDIKEIWKSFERVGPMTYHIFRDDPPEKPLEVAIFCGDLTKPFPTLRKENCDAITMVEVIEHLPEDALECLPFVLFGFYRPRVIVISTPNREYNTCIKGFDLNTFRHHDHKFEWTRKEFKNWCELQLSKYDGYEVAYQTVGRLHSAAEEDFFSVKEHGRCTQIAVFQRRPDAEGPNLDDKEEYDESCLDVIRNFKFPSKTEIENLKISHAHPGWDDDETLDPDHYEYSEDNTECGDEADPDWWKAVWNKIDDEDRAGKGNGQGWDETDPSVVVSWEYDETWAEEFKDYRGSRGDCSSALGQDREDNVGQKTLRLLSIGNLSSLEVRDPDLNGSTGTPLTDESKTSEKRERAGVQDQPTSHLKVRMESFGSSRLERGNSPRFQNTRHNSQRWEHQNEVLVEDDRSEIMQNVGG